MRKKLLPVAAAAAVVLLVIFIVSAIGRAGKRYPAAAAPDLNRAPLVMYGLVQPAGKPVAVAPAVAGTVRRIMAAEGRAVRAGQPLCLLDDAVERAQHDVTDAQIEYSRRAAAISAENLRRNEALLPSGGITEAEYTQLKLKQRLDDADITVRIRQAALADAQLRQKVVAAPIDGVVYKLDLRPGEQFTPADRDRIIIGPPELELVCDLETLWIGRLDTLRTYRVFNAETGEPVGTARVRSQARYLRSRSLQTEDPKQRQSATYQEVVMRFRPDRPGLPIGLSVMVKPHDR
ncbi:MAG: efflux RND transporter periplasmic adaptor subunit [Candidatus Edwardsbacteria bacterium]|jgi:multidrug efflux pump subunit AcrA (membrane-fusion protein)|nr:efflux RND transporter periplasmic adaptor subunit [Candidatus Edwardsbacteria bacterium]